VISPNQTAFIKGRFILDGSLALLEIIHELKRKKLGGVLLKLDFEKAYDRVNWDFLSVSCTARVLMQAISTKSRSLCLEGKQQSQSMGRFDLF
jgi:hypothetical protein